MAYNQQAHFILEKELANELRNSSASDRKVLYQKLYNKLSPLSRRSPLTLIQAKVIALHGR